MEQMNAEAGVVRKAMIGAAAGDRERGEGAWLHSTISCSSYGDRRHRTVADPWAQRVYACNQHSRRQCIWEREDQARPIEARCPHNYHLARNSKWMHRRSESRRYHPTHCPSRSHWSAPKRILSCSPHPPTRRRRGPSLLRLSAYPAVYPSLYTVYLSQSLTLAHPKK